MAPILTYGGEYAARYIIFHHLLVIMAAELRLPANAAAHHGDICETIGICGIWGGLGRYLEAVGHGRVCGCVVHCHLAENGKKRDLS